MGAGVVYAMQDTTPDDAQGGLIPIGEQWLTATRRVEGAVSSMRAEVAALLLFLCLLPAMLPLVVFVDSLLLMTSVQGYAILAGQHQMLASPHAEALNQLAQVLAAR